METRNKNTQGKMKVNLLIIATNKYTQFLPALLRSLKNNFLTSEDVTYSIFMWFYITCFHFLLELMLYIVVFPTPNILAISF